MNISPEFNIIVLEGFFAYSFGELFDKAKEILDKMITSNPKCIVKFKFNEYIITVNEETADSAWEKYISGEFPNYRD